MKDKAVKLVVFVSESYADAVRSALAEAGAGIIGDYTHCSFSVKGVGRFIPLPDAHPTTGTIGKLKEVVEEKIETICDEKNLDAVIAAVKKAHPYEEVAIDVYPLLRHPHEITNT